VRPRPAEPASAPGTGPLVQYALLAGPLLSMLDSSIVNVAVEPIARELHASLTVVQWTVSGYLLALGAGLAGTAYLARRFGTLPVYRASVLAFTAASALCALAPDAGVLVAARVVQGLVAAPLVPLAMSMLLGRGASASDTGASDTGASQSEGAQVISPVAGIMLFLGPALGPTVGGALIGAVGWRGIFLINVPAGALAPRWLVRLTVRVTVLAGFAVLAVASLGLLLIAAATPLWLIAVILACRSVSVGLVINPLLQALVQPLRPDQLGDANTLFNTWQRIAGSFGIGLIAALYATQARTLGPVAALHSAGLVLVAIALTGALGALALPAVRNTALKRT